MKIVRASCYSTIIKYELLIDLTFKKKRWQIENKINKAHVPIGLLN